MKKDATELKTTGQLRLLLAKAARDVVDGTLEIEKATALHKLSKNITESLYSETKIAIFNQEIGADLHTFGDLPLGGSDTEK